MAKISTSRNLEFFPGRIERCDESGPALRIKGPKDKIRSDNAFRARLIFHPPVHGGHLDCLRLQITGAVGDPDEAENVCHLVEIQQAIDVPGGFVVSTPFIYRVPGRAVRTRDGAEWGVEAAAVFENAETCRESFGFEVIPS